MKNCFPNHWMPYFLSAYLVMTVVMTVGASNSRADTIEETLDVLRAKYPIPMTQGKHTNFHKEAANEICMKHAFDESISFTTSGRFFHLVRCRGDDTKIFHIIDLLERSSSTVKVLGELGKQCTESKAPAVINHIEDSEFALEDLITFSQNSDPGKSPNNTLKDLQAINNTDVPETQKKRVLHLIKMMSGFQFESNQVARELVANGVDSHFYSDHSNGAPMVEITSRNGEIEIQDHGIGMNLSDIVYYLLSPGRSRNKAVLSPDKALQGVTGKFGQGFFSVLSYLVEPTDSVTIKTKSESGHPVNVIISKNKNGEFKVKFGTIEGPMVSGTKMEIRSKKLMGSGVGEFEQSIRDSFQFNNRGTILLNKDNISNLNNSDSIYLDHDGSKGSIRIIPPKNPISEGKGILYITINGVVIKTIPYSGINIYPKLVLDLPPDTSLTPDRGTIDLKDHKVFEFLKSSIQTLSERSDGAAILNSLFPLIEKDAEHILPRVRLYPTTPIVPADPTLIGLQTVNSEKVQLLHPKIMSLVEGLPSVKSKLGVEHFAIVINGTFDPPKKFEVLERQGGRPIIVLSEDIDVHSPVTAHIIDTIQKEKAELSDTKSSLSSYHASKPWINLSTLKYTEQKGWPKLYLESKGVPGSEKRSNSDLSREDAFSSETPPFKLDYWLNSPHLRNCGEDPSIFRPIEKDLEFLYPPINMESYL